MNERIKEFLKQNDLCIVDGKITECGLEEAKKFAELIEKECVQASTVFKTYEIKTPPAANWRLHFGDSPNTYFQFYIKTPPNRFQRWMIEKVLGIHWEKVE